MFPPLNVPSIKCLCIITVHTCVGTLNILLASCLLLNTELDICSAILWVWSAAVHNTNTLHHHCIPTLVYRA